MVGEELLILPPLTLFLSFSLSFSFSLSLVLSPSLVSSFVVIVSRLLFMWFEVQLQELGWNWTEEGGFNSLTDSDMYRMPSWTAVESSELPVEQGLQSRSRTRLGSGLRICLHCP